MTWVCVCVCHGVHENLHTHGRVFQGKFNTILAYENHLENLPKSPTRLDHHQLWLLDLNLPEEKNKENMIECKSPHVNNKPKSKIINNKKKITSSVEILCNMINYRRQWNNSQKKYAIRYQFVVTTPRVNQWKIYLYTFLK